MYSLTQNKYFVIKAPANLVQILLYTCSNSLDFRAGGGAIICFNDLAFFQTFITLFLLLKLLLDLCLLPRILLTILLTTDWFPFHALPE